MSRPIPDIILQGIEGWDAELGANFDLIFDSPIPVKEFLSVASLPAAGNFDNCVALVIEPGFKRQWYVSNGTSWISMTPREPRLVTIVDGVEAADIIRFTCQLQDVEGNNIAEKRLIKVWISDSDEGIPQSTGMVGNLSENTGLKILNQGDAIAEFLTTSSGSIEIDVEVSDGREKFLMVDAGFGIFSEAATWAP